MRRESSYSAYLVVSFPQEGPVGASVRRLSLETNTNKRSDRCNTEDARRSICHSLAAAENEMKQLMTKRE